MLTTVNKNAGYIKTINRLLSIKVKFKKGNSNKRAVGQYSTEHILINKFESIAEAARSTKTRVDGIYRVVCGNGKTCNGFVWKYLKIN